MHHVLIAPLIVEDVTVSHIVALPDAVRQLLALLQVDAGEVVRGALKIALIWALISVGNRLVRLIAHRIELAVDDGDDSTLTETEQRGQTIAQLLRSVGRVMLVILGLLLTLNVFMDIGPILAGAGILGLAVSFGAQSLVKDIIAGFFFLIESQFAVGDIIEVAGKSGAVERMTLRVVMLRDVRGTLHMMPNGQITTVSNKTRKWSRAVVDVGIAYGAEVDRALEVFRDEAAGLRRSRLVRAVRWGARNRGVQTWRTAGDHPDPAQDGPRRAVVGGSGVPPPDQEPAGPRRNRDSVSAANRARPGIRRWRRSGRGRPRPPGRGPVHLSLRAPSSAPRLQPRSMPLRCTTP